MFVRLWRRLAILVVATAVAIGGLVATGQQADAATRHPLKVSIANIGSRPDPNLGPMLNNRQPQVMVVSEAYYARTKLSALAKRYGYRLELYTKAQGAEGPDVGVLVRNGVTIKSVWLMKMTKSWHYNGNTRQPRRYPVVVVGYSGATWHVIGVHFPTGGPGGGNSKAWIESQQRIQQYAAAHPSANLVVAGDFNASATVMPKRFPGFTVQGAPNADHAMIKTGRGDRFEGGVISSPVRNANSHGWLTFHLSAAA